MAVKQRLKREQQIRKVKGMPLIDTLKVAYINGSNYFICDNSCKDGRYSMRCLHFRFCYPGYIFLEKIS